MIDEDDLQAYIDERLDGDRHAAMEVHLAAHPEIRDRVAAERRQRAMLRGQLEAKFAEPVPARLRIANIRAERRGAWTSGMRTTAAALVIFVAGATGGWFANGLAPASTPVAPTTSIAQGAAAAFRTFVVEVAHPVEVAATQEAHLLQWLGKRLGRPLAAPDLSRFGYRLMGGRLLPGETGTACQFMYENAQGRRLTIYIRSDVKGARETAFRFGQDEGGVSVFYWIDGPMGYAITGQMPREELLGIAKKVYEQLEG
jgi:anti-sigma factor RsiW